MDSFCVREIGFVKGRPKEIENRRDSIESSWFLGILCFVFYISRGGGSAVGQWSLPFQLYFFFNSIFENSDWLVARQKG